MRSYGTIALCVIVILGGIIYLGGSLQVKGAPIFAHIDKALGTHAFMGTFYKVMSLFRREPREGDDMWTKEYQDFGKVLRKTVE